MVATLWQDHRKKIIEIFKWLQVDPVFCIPGGVSSATIKNVFKSLRVSEHKFYLFRCVSGACNNDCTSQMKMLQIVC